MPSLKSGPLASNTATTTTTMMIAMDTIQPQGSAAIATTLKSNPPIEERPSGQEQTKGGPSIQVPPLRREPRTSSPGNPFIEHSSNQEQQGREQTTNTSPVNPTPNQRKTKWQTLKALFPSSGAAGAILSFIGLIIAGLCADWAVKTYNMGKWTELKDFRDDCRSVRDSGGYLSTACDAALGRELDPPPYLSPLFNRLVRRGYGTVRNEQFNNSSLFRLVGRSYGAVHILQTESFKTSSFLRFVQRGYKAVRVAQFKISFHPTTIPWALDGAVLLISLGLRVLGRIDNKLLILVGTVLLRNLVPWPFWCVECHGMWWRFNTILSNTLCFAILYFGLSDFKSRWFMRCWIVLLIQTEVLLFLTLVLRSFSIAAHAFFLGIASFWGIFFHVVPVGNKVNLEHVVNISVLALVSHGIQFSLFLLWNLIHTLAAALKSEAEPLEGRQA